MSETNGVEVICGDCLEELPKIAAGSVDLVFADAPFNIGMKYPHYDDRRPTEDYLAWLHSLFSACKRVLSPTGSLWAQMGQRYQAEVKVMLDALGLHWRSSVVWCYTFGPNQRKKFTPSWTMLHYYTVHPTRFTWNPIRVPSARQTVYRDKRAHPDGKILDDVWDIPRVCGTFVERVKGPDGKGHSCQTPLEVLRRIVSACSNPGDLVLDPVCGTGTSCVAARDLGRRAIGIELSPQTAEMARRRLTEE